MSTGILREIQDFFTIKNRTDSMNLPQVGEPAPLFEALNENNETVKLTDFKGKKLILFFYPADNTPACTAAACDLRDHYAELAERGFAMLGVSPDSTKKHSNFIQKYKFPFSLIADPDQVVMNAYGVWGEKKFMGRTFDGVLRTTFVIAENGIVEQVIRKVNTKNHAEQILEFYESITVK